MLPGSARIYRKGRIYMKIAVTYDEEGQVFQHFGHTEKFKVFEFGESGLVNTMVVDTNGTGHEAIAGFLAKGNVKGLFCSAELWRNR